METFFALDPNLFTCRELLNIASGTNLDRSPSSQTFHSPDSEKSSGNETRGCCQPLRSEPQRDQLSH